MVFVMWFHSDGGGCGMSLLRVAVLISVVVP